MEAEKPKRSAYVMLVTHSLVFACLYLVAFMLIIWSVFGIVLNEQTVFWSAVLFIVFWTGSMATYCFLGKKLRLWGKISRLFGVLVVIWFPLTMIISIVVMSAIVTGYDVLMVYERRWSVRDLAAINKPSEDWAVFNDSRTGLELSYPFGWTVENLERDTVKYPVSLYIKSKDLDWEHVYMGGDWPVTFYKKGGRLTVVVDAEPFYKTSDRLKKAEVGNRPYPLVVTLSTGDQAIFEEGQGGQGGGLSKIKLVRESSRVGGPLLIEISMAYAKNEESTYKELFREILSTFKLDTYPTN